ncbi:hypothetical protein FE392_20210 [Xenorhabdus sp. 12]|uniref:Uncharacterized protein n=1 Tax=Xenorhabdus santafensis TaxID=2582833 RepID=A0ABU4SFJ6_9GAMM|nr:hypothetical protein [Xenorhabdus sp. 12]OTZ32537.1 hypothetical protein BK760_23670 [Bacillus thuringiensis serovar tolworthi]OTZ95663.1 hypothetical protein BK770_20420 [Bacillus thuringiensis serovar colmeri]RYS54672.1 hypothetical protein D7Z27_31895 [Bacillus thuringiensis]
MKPVRVYFVCSFLRGLYCLKVCSFQLMENRRVSILKLMGMCLYPNNILIEKGRDKFVFKTDGWLVRMTD